MKDNALNDFQDEKECVYKEERYSARDNGAVLRHPRIGKRPRPNDSKWTFGKLGAKGYLYISSESVHRVIATAFHGNSPTSNHVVDHIDTNRQNNRPGNLRWLTRLENVLLNPITVKRIEVACGSLEAFLANPSSLTHLGLDPNFKWMRKVNPEESRACLDRMHLWAKSDTQPSGRGALGEWIFKSSSKKASHEPLKMFGSNVESIAPQNLVVREQKNPQEVFLAMPQLTSAITPGAAQQNWRTPSEFPSCPQVEVDEPIKTYSAKLIAGEVFSQNVYSTFKVLESAVIHEGSTIYVMCKQTAEDAIKPWSLAKVTYEQGLYIHSNVGTFFTKDGAEKQFCLARGLEWTGGETFDEFCC